MKIIKIGIIIILLGLLWIFKPVILLYIKQGKEPRHNITYNELPKNDLEMENNLLKDDSEYVSSYEKKLYRHKKSSTNDKYMSAYTKNLLKHKKSTTKNTYSSTFRCDGRQHCSQMRSYEEAKYFNSNCPNTKMDGDHDGIPCERQFGRYD